MLQIKISTGARISEGLLGPPNAILGNTAEPIAVSVRQRNGPLRFLAWPDQLRAVHGARRALADDRDRIVLVEAHILRGGRFDN